MKQYSSQCGHYSMHCDKFNTPDRIVRHELHNHNMYELFYLNSGQVFYNIENTEYLVNDNDVVLVNYNEYHKLTVLKPNIFDRIVIQVDESFISNLQLDCDIFAFIRTKPIGKDNHILAKDIVNSDIKALFHKLSQYTEDSSENDLLIKCALIELLVALKNNSPSSINDNTIIKSGSFIKKIIHHIDSNLDKDLSLDNLASVFFVSKYHMCHEFKKSIGIPITEYVINKRVLYANHLITRGKTATEACYAAGFQSYPNFYRSFKLILGYPPSKNKHK